MSFEYIDQLRTYMHRKLSELNKQMYFILYGTVTECSIPLYTAGQTVYVVYFLEQLPNLVPVELYTNTKRTVISDKLVQITHEHVFVFEELVYVVLENRLESVQ